MLLGTLGGSLLGSILADKRVIRASKRSNENDSITSYNQNCPEFLMTPHPSTNFEIQRHYQKELTFNGVYSRNNLPKIKHGAYVISLDEYKLVGAHWIALYVYGDSVAYFDGFGIEHISKKI